MTTTLSSMELINFFGPRIGIAILCGFIVGVERELKGKTTGLRTNILICVGAMVFTSLSELIYNIHGFGDPTRIAAQIVSGIGFLGGGAILHSKGAVHGITTAASIWVVSAIGVLTGLGFFAPAIFVAVVCSLILWGESVIGLVFTSKLIRYDYLQVETSLDFDLKVIEDLLVKNHSVHSEISVENNKNKKIIKIKTHFDPKLINSLSNVSGVSKVIGQKR